MTIKCWKRGVLEPPSTLPGYATVVNKWRRAIYAIFHPHPQDQGFLLQWPLCCHHKAHWPHPSSDCDVNNLLRIPPSQSSRFLNSFRKKLWLQPSVARDRRAAWQSSFDSKSMKEEEDLFHIYSLSLRQLRQKHCFKPLTIWRKTLYFLWIILHNLVQWFLAFFCSVDPKLIFAYP